jgi:hypothetical protein
MLTPKVETPGCYPNFFQTPVDEKMLRDKFSSLVIDKAISIAKNIIEKKQWNSMPFDLVFFICKTLSLTYELGFENICQQLLLIPRLSKHTIKLIQHALIRYKEYSDAFNRFSKAYDGNKIPFEEAFVNILKESNYKIAYFEPNTSANIQALIEVIINPDSKLALLYLDGNNIGDFGVRPLASALPNCNLTLLSLRGNQIGDYGAQAIADALSDPNLELRTLYLDNNNISDPGVQALATSLLQNRKLTYLSLTGINIGDDCVKVLAEIVVYLKHHSHQITIVTDCENYEDYLTQAEQEYSERVNEQLDYSATVSSART